MRESQSQHRHKHNTHPLHVRAFAVFMSFVFMFSGFDTRAFAEVADELGSDSSSPTVVDDLGQGQDANTGDSATVAAAADETPAETADPAINSGGGETVPAEPNAPPADGQQITIDEEDTSAQQVAEVAEKAEPAKLGAKFTATLWAWDADAKKTLGNEPVASVELEPVEGEQKLAEGMTATLARDANDQSAWTIKLTLDPAVYPELTAIQLAVELDGKVAAVTEAQLTYDANKNDPSAKPQKLEIERWNATKATLEAARGIATLELSATTDAAKVDEARLDWEKVEAERKAAEEAEAARKAEEERKAAEKAEAAKNAEEAKKAEEQKKAEAAKKAEEAAAKKAAAEAMQNATFEQSQIVGGTTVTVTADPGVFPQGAKLRVKQLGGTEALQARAAAAREREAGQKVAKSLTFDVCVLDAAGREIEPNTKAGQVKVSFTNKDVANKNLSASVYHVEDSGQAERLDATEKGTTVVAPTDGFSSYTVEFTYNELQYVMQGDTTIPLQDILDFVGLTGTVTDASSNAPELFDVQRDESGIWQVVAKQAFSTTHALYVTIDGVRYEIVVTDQYTNAQALAFFKSKYDIWKNQQHNADYAQLVVVWLTSGGVNAINSPGSPATYTPSLSTSIYCSPNENFTALEPEPDASNYGQISIGVATAEGFAPRGFADKQIIYHDYSDPTWTTGKVQLGSNCGAPGYLMGKTVETTLYFYCDGYAIDVEQPLVSVDTIVNNNMNYYAAHDFGLFTLSEHKVYTITWDGNGGTPGTPTTDVNQGSAINTALNALPTASRTGYTHNGWWTDATAGSQITLNTVPTGDVTYHAHWTANTYNVALDKNGGTGGRDSVTATYGSAMPSITSGDLPTRTGYTFAGYYDAASGGTKYYNANGTSAKNWNKTSSNPKLYAHWTANKYTVTLNKNAGNDTSGTAGTASVDATFDANMPTATMPTRTGYTFEGYYDTSEASGGNQYYNSSGASAKKWDKTQASTLYARWTAKKYYIQYDLNKGSGSTDPAFGGNHPTDATYDSTVAIDNPTREGYTFTGWNITEMDTVEHTYGSSKTSATSIDKTLETTFKNLHSTAGTVKFTATWTPNTYTITYNKGTADGTETMDSTSATFDQDATLSANAFTKTGYHFANWKMTHKDGTAIEDGGTFADGANTVKNLTATENGSATLTAQWVPNNYTIVYHKNDGTDAVVNEPATFDESETAKVAGDEFINHGRTLVSWNTQPDGQGTSYALGETGNLTNVIPGNGEGTAKFHLYAQWTGVVPLAIYDDEANALVFTSLSWEAAQPYLYASKNGNAGVELKDIQVGNANYHIDGKWWDMAVTETGTTAPKWATENIMADVTTVVFDTAFHTVQPRSMYQWFSGFTNLTTVTNMSSVTVDTSELTDMREIFKGCTSLQTIDLSEFATQKSVGGIPQGTAVNLTSMFEGCSNLKEAYLEGLDTTNAGSSTGSMFKDCENLSYLTIGPNWRQTTYGGNAVMPQALYRIKNSADTGVQIAQNVSVPTYDTTNYVTTETMGGKEHTNVNAFAVRYKVRFDKNGGTGTQMDDMTFYYGQTLNLSPNAYAHDGLAFLGWNTDRGTDTNANGVHTGGALGAAKQFNDREAVSDLASKTGDVVTLYAAWQKAYAAYTENDSTLTFFLSSKPTAEVTSINGNTITQLYEVDPQANYTEASQRPWKDVAANVTTVKFQGDADAAQNAGFVTVKPQSMAHWFEGFTQLTTINGLAFVNTSQVTSLDSMFKGCSALTSVDLSSISDLANVTTMASMFEGATSLTNVTFGDAAGQSLGTKLTSMQAMFKGCTSLVDKLKFDGATNKIDTSKVTNFSDMFANCGTSLTRLDLSGLNTASATNMEGMFAGDTYLSYLKLGSGWQIDAVQAKATFPCYLYRVEPEGAEGTIEGATGTSIPSATADGALWVAKVTVNFNSAKTAEDGDNLVDTGTTYGMDPQTFYYGVTQSLNEVRYLHRTKAFIGWRTSLEATSVIFDNREKVTFDPEYLHTYATQTADGYTTTLYAMWTEGITGVKAVDLTYTGSYLTPAVTVYGVGNAQLKEYTGDGSDGVYTIEYYRSREEKYNEEKNEYYYEYRNPIAANEIVDAGTYYACVQGREGTAYNSSSTWDVSFVVKPANLNDATAGLSLTTGTGDDATTATLVSPKTYTGEDYYAYKDGATATLNGVNYVPSPMRAEGSAPKPDFTVTWYSNRTVADDGTYVYDEADKVSEADGVKNAGTYYAVLDGGAQGTSSNCTGKAAFTLVINKANLSSYGKLSFTEKDGENKEKTEYDYMRGAAVEPDVKLVWSPEELSEANAGSELVKDEDYSLLYINNTECSDSAIVFAQAVPSGNYAGGLIRTFSIQKAEIKDEDISVANQAATGNVIDPGLVVTHGKDAENNPIVLTKDVDYTLSYEYKTTVEGVETWTAATVQAAGEYRAVVTGIGNYGGTAHATFEVMENAVAEFTNAAGKTTLYLKSDEVTAPQALQNALNAAKDAPGGVVTLLADVQAQSNIVTSAGTNTTFDLNGHTISLVGDTTNPALVVEDGAALTIVGTSGGIDLSAQGYNDSWVVINQGTLTIDSGTFASNMHLLKNQGTLYINGGVFNRNERTFCETVTVGFGATTKVFGGVFNKNDVSDKVADGYQLCMVDDAGKATTDAANSAGWSPVRSLDGAAGSIASFAGATDDAPIADQTYVGSELTPRVVVSWTGFANSHEMLAKEAEDPSANGIKHDIAASDYELEWTNNVKVAAATSANAPTVTAVGAGTVYVGATSQKLSIVKRSVAEYTLEFRAKDSTNDEAWTSKYSETYTTQGIEPEVRLVCDMGGPTIKDIIYQSADGAENFKVFYSNNTDVGEAYALVKGTGESYTGDTFASFTITPKSIAQKTDGETFDVVLDEILPQVKQENGVEPSVTLTYNGTKLNVSTDYTAAYANNTAETTDYNLALVTITGTGNYTGERTANFAITEPVCALNVDGTPRNFASLQLAIDAAGTDNAKITLLKNVNESASVAANQHIWLYLAGKTLTGAAGKATITNNGELTVGVPAEGDGDVMTPGTIVAAEGQSALVNHGTLNLNKGTVESAGTTAPLVVNGWDGRTDGGVNLAALTVADGTTLTGGSWVVQNLDYGNATINGGTLTGANGGAGVLQNRHTATVAGGTLTAPTGYALEVNSSANANDPAHAYQAGQLTVTGGDITSTAAELLHMAGGSSGLNVTFTNANGAKTGAWMNYTEGSNFVKQDSASKVNLTNGFFSGNDANATQCGEVFGTNCALGEVTVTGNEAWAGNSHAGTWYTPMRSVANVNVEGLAASYAYNGEAVDLTTTDAEDGRIAITTKWSEDTLTAGAENDYTVSYYKDTLRTKDAAGRATTDAGFNPATGPIEPGTYHAFINGTERFDGNDQITGYTGTKQLTVTVVKAQITTDTDVKDLQLADQTYTGQGLQPTFDVEAIFGTKATLTKGTDYTVEYTNNVNVTSATTNAYAIVKGVGEHYEGTWMVPFKVVAKHLDNSDSGTPQVVVADVPAQAHTGAAVCPVPTVTYNGKTLHKDVDFTVTYINNTEVTSDTSRARVVLTGIGNFDKTTGVDFDIVAPVAQIGDGADAKTYGTLQQAIDEAGAGQTVILLQNVTENVTVPSGKAVTLDLANSSVDGGTGFAITIANGATLTITDTSQGSDVPTPEAGGKITSSGAAVDVQAGGSLYLTKGTIESTGNHAVNNAGGVVMSGGTVKYGNTYQAFAGAGSASITDGFLSRNDANASVTGGKELGKADETWYTPKPSLTYASISGLEARAYTGEAFDVQPSASWEGKALTAGTDYAGKWYSNADCTTEATEIKDSGTYYYKIVPAENSTYIGEQVAPLVVNGQGTTNLSVTVTGTHTYTGSAITPDDDTNPDDNVVVKDGDRELTKGTDYTLAYYNNTNAGTAVVIATFQGNYSGAKAQEFTIAPASIAQAQINANNVVDTGAAQTPTVSATLTGFDSFGSNDYDVTFVGPGEATHEAATVTAVGTYKVKVTGKGNFTGTAEGSVKVTAKKNELENAITEATNDKTETNQDTTTDVPAGVAQALQDAIDAAQQLKDNPDATDEQIATALKNLEDAQAAYDKAKQPAQGTEGTGSLSDLAAAGKVTVSPDPIGDRAYTGSAIEPQVTVSYKADDATAAVVLEAGKDYLVEYQNNTEVGTATVKITGIGKFYERPSTGTASAAVITKTFSITKTAATASDLTNAITTATQDKSDTEANDSTVTVPDNVKQALQEAIDAANTVKENQNATPEQIADALKALEDAQAAYDQAKKPKNDASQTDITDDANFTLTPSPIPAQVYTGDQVRPKVTVKNGDTVLTEGTDYVLSYENNVAKGENTATVAVHGIGAYKGSKSANFSIKNVAEGTEDEREAIADALVDAMNDKADTDADPTTEVPAEVANALQDAIDEAQAVLNNADAAPEQIAKALQDLEKAQAAYDQAKTNPNVIDENRKDVSTNDFTIEAIPAQLYTGKQVCPSVVVKEGDTVLTEGSDYVLSYGNNVDKGDAATVTVHGIRDYKGTKTANFTIKDADANTADERTALTDALADAAKDIADTTNDPNTTAGDTEKQALENAIKAAEDVLSNPDSTPQQIADALKAVEDAQTAYDKTKVPTDNTAERKSITTCTVDKIPAQVKTGSALKPGVTVKDRDKTLVAGTDYVAEYANNTEVGTATVIITGIGAYKDNTVANFKIVETEAEKKAEDLKDAVADASQDITNTTNDNTTDVDAEKQKALQEAIDAAQQVLNDHNSSEQQVQDALNAIEQAKAAFDDSKTPASGKITAVEVPATDLVYDNTEKKPALTIKVDGVARNLTEGTDYDVTWVANTNAGTAIVVVTGKGNYTGGASTTFTINPIKVDVPTAVDAGTYDGTQKTGVSVANGMNDIYTLDGNTATNAGNHTAYARLKDRTNYTWNLATPSNADQSISWTIGQRNVSITAENLSKTYGEDDPTLTYTIGGTGLVSPTDLGVISCTRAEGDNAGTYEVTPNYTANNNYSITMNKGTFTIEPADLAKAQLGTIPNVAYNGENTEFPAITVTYGGNTLAEDTDYVLEFATDLSFSADKIVTKLENKDTYYAWAKAKDDGNFTGTSLVGSFLVTDAVATVTKANGDADPEIYTSLQAAIDAAENNGSVTLLVPVMQSVSVAGKEITLDLGKSTLTGTADGPVITVAEGATLNLRATDGGTAKAADGKSVVSNAGTLDVDLGEGKLEGDTAPAIVNAATGNLSMESGFVSYNPENGNKAIQNNGGQANVTGGHFSGNDANDFVAPGYELVSTTVNDEPWYGLGRSLNGAKLVMEPNVVTYSGKGQKPEMTVSYQGTALKEGDEYKISWVKQLASSGLGDWLTTLDTTNNTEPINAGNYTVTATGVGAYQGSTATTFTILPYDITAQGQVTMSSVPDQKYSGTAFEPELTIADKNGNTLVKGIDYDVTYVNNTTGPTAVIKVVGKGNYTGATTTNFQITGGPTGTDGGVNVSKLTMSPTSMSLAVGNSGTAQVTVAPNDAANKKVTWHSADTSIATVDANGKVTAKKAGTTTIIAVAQDGSGASATCVVTVTNPPAPTPAPTKVPSVSYRTHVQRIGWQKYVKDGAMSGTSGKSYRLEGINIKLSNLPVSGGITYRTHVQRIGWQGWRKDGAMSGTSGKSYRLEAIEIKLTGELAKQYDVYYRVHCQRFGWMGWAKNGQRSGSAGYSRRLEGIQIVLVKKGQPAPGATFKGIKQNVSRCFAQK